MLNVIALFNPTITALSTVFGLAFINLLKPVGAVVEYKTQINSVFSAWSGPEVIH